MENGKADCRVATVFLLVRWKSVDSKGVRVESATPWYGEKAALAYKRDEGGARRGRLLRWPRHGDIRVRRGDRRAWRVFSEFGVEEIRVWAHRTS